MKLGSIDPLNLSVLRLELKYNDLSISKATGFFYSAQVKDKGRVFFLVTNWHVISGRHTDSPHTCLNSNLTTPNKIVTKFNLKESTSNNILQQEITIPLYDNAGKASWIRHPKGPSRDIAAVNLGSLENYIAEGINTIADSYDMAIEIGNDVFILGYPLGFSHILDTPIWKRGIIASEPHIEVSENHSRIIIDATTRSGMSGAPVIMREKTHYLSEDGTVISKVNAKRFIGIYSSRPPVGQVGASIDQSNPERAEIGYVLKSGAIDEMILSQNLGHRLNEQP